MNRLKFVAVLLFVAAAARAQTEAVSARIDRILREVPLIDGHNDLPEQYEDRVKDHLAQIDIRQDQSKLTPPLMTDIPRLRQGMDFLRTFGTAMRAQLAAVEIAAPSENPRFLTDIGLPQFVPVTAGP